MAVRFQIREPILLFQSEKSAWHFVLVPPPLSAELRAHFRAAERGFGSLRVEARIGGSSWRTSLFFDSRRAGYLLPIKAAIRKQEKIQAGDSPAIGLEILI